MKKIIMFVLLIALISILSSCRGKKADPINLPQISDIESVRIIQNNQTIENSNSYWISELINEVSAGESTTRKSVQDVPNVSEYIKINFSLNDGIVIQLDNRKIM